MKYVCFLCGDLYDAERREPFAIAVCKETGEATPLNKIKGGVYNAHTWKICNRCARAIAFYSITRDVPGWYMQGVRIEYEEDSDGG